MDLVAAFDLQIKGYGMPGFNRRRFLSLAGAASCGLAVTRFKLTSFAQSADVRPADAVADDLLNDGARRALQRGLSYLVRQQNEDGSFGVGIYDRNVGIASLAGMAFMAAGSTPGRGPHGKQLNKCLEFVLGQVQETGFIASPGRAASHGPMYEHGFATMFLAEAYGMTSRGDIRDKLSKAVQIIVNSQNSEGGWRYEPRKKDADISVTACQVMALRAARNAGIFVSDEKTIFPCLEYIKQCQNPDGGFMYQASGGMSSFARSAAGMVALYSAGVYTGNQIDSGLNYLRSFLPRSEMGMREQNYFYGHYYAVQVMWHAGGSQWSQWYPAVRDSLISQQGSEGQWDDPLSSEYATAMSCLILQMPNTYLPIFQR